MTFLMLSLLGCRHFWDKDPNLLKRDSLQELKEEPTKEDKTFVRVLKKKVVQEKQFPPSFYKLVSVTISEALPLKQVLVQLAKQAGVDLHVDQRVDQKIIFSSSQKPFIEVIKGICDVASLRFEVKGEVLKILLDQPYYVNYNVQFLNLVRKTENRVSTATDVFSSVNNNQRLWNDNGSTSSVNMSSNNSFWDELEANLEMILQQDNFEDQPSSYSVHKQGGLISVFATSKQHQLVDEYLEKLRKLVSTQVLIEAKVVEVHLKDHYKGGINWNKVTGNDFYLDAKFADLASAGNFARPDEAMGERVAVGVAGKNFSGILNAIENFGALRTLSSPRLTVLNNQTAILKVAKNQVYFRLNYDKQFSLNNNREVYSLSSDIQTVPIGLILTVQASIDSKTGQILLSLRPTISRLTQSVRDPAVDIALLSNSNNANIANLKPSLIPIVEVREMDSVLKLNDGEIAVMGGLMEARSAQDQAGVPGVAEIPVVGELVKGTAASDEIVELVILLRATIIEENNNVSPADERLVNKFTSDPRPFH